MVVGKADAGACIDDGVITGVAGGTGECTGSAGGAVVWMAAGAGVARAAGTRADEGGRMDPTDGVGMAIGVSSIDEPGSWTMAGLMAGLLIGAWPSIS